MIETKNGGPAFPVHPGSAMDGQLVRDTQGMTLRDYFAAKAMQGVLSNFGDVGLGSDETNSGISACAYAIADAMLKEREK